MYRFSIIGLVNHLLLEFIFLLSFCRFDTVIAFSPKTQPLLLESVISQGNALRSSIYALYYFIPLHNI